MVSIWRRTYNPYIVILNSIKPSTVFMKKALIWVGVVFLVLGILAGVVRTEEEQAFGLFSTTSTPYVPYMIPLLLAGIILIIVGAFVGRKE